MHLVHIIVYSSRHSWVKLKCKSDLGETNSNLSAKCCHLLQLYMTTVSDNWRRVYFINLIRAAQKWRNTLVSCACGTNIGITQASPPFRWRPCPGPPARWRCWACRCRRRRWGAPSLCGAGAARRWTGQGWHPTESRFDQCTTNWTHWTTSRFPGCVI